MKMKIQQSDVLQEEQVRQSDNVLQEEWLV